MYFTVPTPVRNIKVAMSTLESIFVTWDHPEYPNSQLLNYIFYYNDNPSMLQLSGGISTDGFVDTILETVTSYNLTGLPPFTNHTILITVTGRDVGNSPFVMESLQRTNATSEEYILLLNTGSMNHAEKSYALFTMKCKSFIWQNFV